MLPAITLSPIFFVIGLLSPVIKDSSVCVVPFIIVPSTDIFSPGFVITVSPLFISLIVTTTSFPFFNIVPFFGVIITKFFILSTALSLFFLSIYLPNFTKRIIILDASKYSFIVQLLSPIYTKIAL